MTIRAITNITPPPVEPGRVDVRFNEFYTKLELTRRKAGVYSKDQLNFDKILVRKGKITHHA